MAVNVDNRDHEKGDSGKRRKKCRYFNRGHCKYTTKCRFSHPDEICSEILENKTCEKPDCPHRHPKVCKWWGTSSGCKRVSDCNYLHVTIVCGDQVVEDTQIENEVQCFSCKSLWQSKSFGVEYRILVFDDGWSLLDERGYLRLDI